MPPSMDVVVAAVVDLYVAGLCPFYIDGAQLTILMYVLKGWRW